MKPIRHLHRPFGLLAVASVVAWSVRQDSAAPASTPAIAFVGAFAEPDDDSFARFRAALASAWPSQMPPPSLRYHEGSDMDEGRLRSAVLAAAAERPAVVVLPSGDSAAAARSLKVDAPLVFASFPDPVRKGIVDSLRRPGRRATGVALGDTLDLKRLELLKDAFPSIATVAMLVDNSWMMNEDTATVVGEASRRLGLRVVVRVADTTEALEALMSTAEAAAFDAWYVPPTYIADLAEAEIIATLKRLRLPSIHTSEHEVANGALMAYSQDTRFAYDAMAELTRRVALGEDAGSIPVQRPYRYTLSVRIEPDAPWARIEPSVVRRADRVHRP
jgi:putative tryptophan/tyrosine transport system substrate-binding protein